MNRYTLVGWMLLLVPAFARGDQPMPMIPPATGSAPVATLAMTTAPTVAPSANCRPVCVPGILGHPLPVLPTVPCPSDGCANPCQKKPGFVRHMMNWFCGNTASSCTPCPPVVSQPCMTGTCGATTKVIAKPARTGACWEKFKAWMCWKPCNEQFLPVLRAVPYEAPVLAYFRHCNEPNAVPPCGSCEKPKCATGGCPTPAVQTAVGPVLAQRSLIVRDWLPNTATPPATPAIVPASATVKPQPWTNPLARPFTSP